MKSAQDLQAVMPELDAIPAAEVLAPPIPVPAYCQEAEDLHVWLQPDRALFVAHGQPEALLDGLTVRAGALREAESAWNAARYDKEDAQARYEAKAGGAAELLARTIRHYRYAFRRHPALLGRLPSATSWMTHADRIQSLNDVAVLGREHVDLLEAAGFDPARLDELAAASDDLAESYAAAHSERASGRGSKMTRDRAYTHLKAAVDEIRAAGRFLFWDDEARLRGYRSEYLRKSRAKGDDVEPGTDGVAADAAAAASPTAQETSQGARDAAR